MDRSAATINVKVRVTGDRARRVREALDVLGAHRDPGSDDPSLGLTDIVFDLPLPRPLYDQAVVAASGSVDVAELVLAATAVDVLLDDAARARAGLPVTCPTN